MTLADLQTRVDLAIIRYRTLCYIPGHGTMHGLADPQLLRPPTELSCTPTHHFGETLHEQKVIMIKMHA